MAARLRDDPDDLLPELVGQGVELLPAEPAEVGRQLDAIEKGGVAQEDLAERNVISELMSLPSPGSVAVSWRSSAASVESRVRVASTP